MPEAHAERRDSGLWKAPHDFERDAGFIGRARPGRHDHPVVAADEQLVDGRVVVAHHLDVGAELADVLHQVVGEAVVVVEDQQSHTAPEDYGQSGWATASSIAWRTARALASDSRNS